MNCPTLALVLSVAVLSPSAKAQDSTSNNETSIHESTQDESKWARVVQAVAHSDQEFTFHIGLAQAIGLPGQMTAKRSHISISGDNNAGDDRDVYVFYPAETSDADRGNTQPMYVYLHRGHSSKRELKAHYFRVSLDGQLELSITLLNKRDTDGKVLREGRTRVEEDIEDPEIQKIFKTEISYWLNDWLKKQKSPSASATQ